MSAGGPASPMAVSAMAKKPTKPEEPPVFDAATEADLDAASEISAEDIARAQQRWRDNAPSGFKDLLDAQPADAPPPKK